MERLYNVAQGALHKCALLNPGGLTLHLKTTANYTLPLHRNPGVDFEDWVIAQLDSFIEKAKKVYMRQE